MTLRDDARAILTAALEGADPAPAVSRAIRVAGAVKVIGVGKAAARMAEGAEQKLNCDGLVVVRDVALTVPRRIEVVQSAHPIPDERSLQCGERLWNEAKAMPAESTLIFLLSGGASALAERLPAGLTLDSLQELTRRLLLSGAPIEHMNVIRKHLSRFKGGQLALACRCFVVVLVLSDVIGASIDTVGSGPLCPDPSSIDDAARLLDRYELSDWRQWLVETPKAGDACFDRVRVHCIGDNRTMVDAAVTAAEALGYRTVRWSDTVQGQAADAGRAFAQALLKLGPRTCLVGSGETTVTLPDGAPPGGRCQEMALAAASELQGPVLFLAAASDGSDGTTDAAGAFADGTTWRRGDAATALARHDSHRFFDALGDLLRLPATGTNVNDLYVGLVGES